MIAPGALMNVLSNYKNTTNLLNAVIGFSAGVLILFPFHICRFVIRTSIITVNKEGYLYENV